MTTINISPVRVDKIEEVKKLLQDVEIDKMKLSIKNNKPLTILEKIGLIFAGRQKRISGDEGKEDGLSIKELALILYPHKVTIEQMIIGPNDLYIWRKVVWPVILSTKKSLERFKKSPISKNINLYCLRSNVGEYLYYDIQNTRDLEKVKINESK